MTLQWKINPHPSDPHAYESWLVQDGCESSRQRFCVLRYLTWHFCSNYPGGTTTCSCMFCGPCVSNHCHYIPKERTVKPLLEKNSIKMKCKERILGHVICTRCVIAEGTLPGFWFLRGCSWASVYIFFHLLAVAPTRCWLSGWLYEMVQVGHIGPEGTAV